MFEPRATPWKVKCSTLTRMEVEDVVEQEYVDSAKDEIDEVRPMKTTPNFGKKAATIKECSEEGRAFMSVQADKTQLNADIATKSVTTKKRESTASTSRQLANYVTNSDHDDHGGMFVMRHRENSMSTSTSTTSSDSEDVYSSIPEPQTI